MTGASSSSLPSLKNGILWLAIVCSASLVQGSPYRSKNKARDSAQLVYDQKQTGDYNIQLHLKDFQIIALLGDDTSEYEDYNYDYEDFTIKPSSTSKPSSTTSSSTTLAPPSTTASSSASVTNKGPSTLTNNSQPDLAIAVSNLTKKPEPTILNIVTDESTITTTENTPNTSPDLSPMVYSAQQPQLPLTQLDSLIPGKIKVQIVEDSSLTSMAEPALGIVPGEDVHPEIGDAILQGEISSYRRCSSGYARDKKGRCRRVRKPGVVGSQLPFGLGNIASSLASRLRLKLPASVPHSFENDAN